MDLEVLELVDAEHAVLELPGVEDHPLLHAQRAPQDAVLGLAVARELDAPDPELVALVDDELDVGHQVVALDDLVVDAGEHVAGVAVELLDLLEAIVDHVLAQPAALGLLERVLEELVGQHLVALEQDVAELPALALLHRDDDAELALLGPALAVLAALEHVELGIAHHQVLVAGVVVDLAHVDRGPPRPWRDCRCRACARWVMRFDFLVFFIALRSVPSPKTSLPSNVDLADLDLVALVDQDHDAQLVVGDPLELNGRRRRIDTPCRRRASRSPPRAAPSSPFESWLPSNSSSRFLSIISVMSVRLSLSRPW